MVHSGSHLKLKSTLLGTAKYMGANRDLMVHLSAPFKLRNVYQTDHEECWKRKVSIFSFPLLKYKDICHYFLVVS